MAHMKVNMKLMEGNMVLMKGNMALTKGNSAMSERARWNTGNRQTSKTFLTTWTKNMFYM